ncbi:hypothetical protein DL766_000676 [Monosporascus sp. MC13-8B]|uniref:Alanine racemase N-terminal domain-containing protein n=1 Tax=Monosporascus cannonballus TaxID=155416 RepID=A0ABY0H1B5_9PEZI|nr:hypothetical protein DL762_006710 [Monosporascus cannonballus]RYP39036.1 hypothetical protein DL766_000676 [Monosporascus sp. MC13-8B]
MAGSQLSKEALRGRFVGKSLHEVGTPAVVLDRAKLEANCNLMLEAVQRLGLGWRCHIKTHKVRSRQPLRVTFGPDVRLTCGPDDRAHEAASGRQERDAGEPDGFHGPGGREHHTAAERVPGGRS